MGHLTYISDETCKLFEKCHLELEDELKGIRHMLIPDYLESEEWNDYVTHSLHQTQELDRQPLGGMKPDLKLGDDKILEGAEKDPSNDQFARFLCQQLVKDLPDRFLGADSSDEEDDKRWIGYSIFNIRELDQEFNIGEVISRENIFTTQYSVEGDEETVSDDLESLQLESSETETREDPKPSETPKSPLPNPPTTNLENWADFSQFSSSSQD